MVQRWQSYLSDGRFALAVDSRTPLGPKASLAQEGVRVDVEGVIKKAGFWTQPFPYWDMNILAPDFWESLRDSALVIFKVRDPISSRHALTEQESQGDLQ